MTEKKTKPDIRFKGFDGDWDECELETIVEFNPKSELPEIFEYVDLESVVGTEMITHREERKVSAPSRAQRLAKKGDLFYQTVRPYQKNNYLFEKSFNNYVFSTGYAQMRPLGDGYFLLCLVQNDKFIKSVLNRCTGTSYPSINSTDLARIQVNVPVELDEQTQTGNYFQHIDTLITLHQRKYDKLTTLKTAMLEKMFPKSGSDVPEIRFKEFTGGWKEQKLGEIADNLDYGLNAAAIKFDGINKYIRITDIDDENNEFKTDALTSPDTNLSNAGDFRLKEGDLLFARTGASVGKTYFYKISDGVVFFAGFLIRARIKPEYDPVFIFQNTLTNKYKSFIRFTSQRSGQPGVNAQEYSSFEIFTPILSEQAKIGAFFKQLDNLLSFQKKELEKLKTMKKALLEKMFV